MAAFRTRRRVEFADTDLEGMVHFARFLVYMETAEHELLAAAGVTIGADADGRRWTWPRVKVECDYLAPLRFGDEVEIAVTVERRGKSSVTYSHQLSRDGEAVARGRVTAVCCRRAEDGALRPQEIPQGLATLLDEHA